MYVEAIIFTVFDFVLDRLIRCEQYKGAGWVWIFLPHLLFILTSTYLQKNGLKSVIFSRG